MKIIQRKNVPERKEIRQDLRHNPTLAEAELWEKLKGKKVSGLKFRRQFGIGPYVLDFYCPEIRLAIELDGPVHDSGEAIIYDNERTAYLAEGFGIHVLRFRNEQIFKDMDSVLDAIKKMLD